MENRLGEMNEKFGNMKTKFAALETKIANVNSDFSGSFDLAAALVRFVKDYQKAMYLLNSLRM
ncbi:hypothetical protein BGX38DRAFT_1188202 [Terfezia claveryi]|nr:hypothetical protein BGX38DRAFT_1188202 [Terfezia claveryi]